jgi:hypothetical protein
MLLFGLKMTIFGGNLFSCEFVLMVMKYQFVSLLPIVKCYLGICLEKPKDSLSLLSESKSRDGQKLGTELKDI